MGTGEWGRVWRGRVGEMERELTEGVDGEGMEVTGEEEG